MIFKKISNLIKDPRKISRLLFIEKYNLIKVLLTVNFKYLK